MPDHPAPGFSASDTPPPRTTGGNFRWEPPTAEELQALLPGYTIEKLLGRGGMGAVYRGVQTNLDRPVAIKILPPGVEKEDPSFAERFKNEAKLMAKLNHPAVVAVHDFGTTLGGQLYFAMEYVDGSDVAQMISAQGRLPPEHALAITAHVCDALQAAHELGIVHRDIKPANVLLNMKGQVKVADFGLAKIEEPGSHGLTKTGFAMGTPDFVAPEALTLGTAIDGRADIYAVGVMLYQMLTGNIPRGAFKPASVLVPSLDPRYDPIIIKAMQHDREERYQSSAELRGDLDVILTVPLVQRNAPESAAIPVSQVAQMPAQRSAAQKPQGKPPQPKGATGVPSGTAQPARTTSEQPAKSKAPLFIGLGLAAALGIGAFVMFGGGKKTASTAAVGDSAPSARPAAASKPAAAGLSPSTEPWHDLLHDAAMIELSGAAKLSPEGLRFTDSGAAVPHKNQGPQRDGAVRMRTTFGSLNVYLLARNTSAVGGYQLAARNEKAVLLKRFDSVARQFTEIREFTLGTPLQKGQDFELELRAVGQTFTVKLNDEILGTVTDATFPQGSFGVSASNSFGSPALVTALEVLQLGASGGAGTLVATSPKPAVPSSPSPSTSKSSDPQFPPGQWVKLYTKAEDLTDEQRTSGMKLEDGWLRLGQKKSWINVPRNQDGRYLEGNYGIRLRFLRHANHAEHVQISTRLQPQNTKCSYLLRLGITTLACSRIVETEPAYTTLFETPSPEIPKAGEEGTLEFYVVGSRLFGRTGPTLVSSALDDRYKQGRAQISGSEDVRDIEVINLDGIPEAEALKILGVDEKGNDTRKPAALAVSSPTSSPQFPPGQWVKLFTKAADLPENLRKSGVRFEDGWIMPSSDGNKPTFVIAELKSGNLAVRARLRCDEGQLLGSLSVREGIDVRKQADHCYRVKLDRRANDALLYGLFQSFDQSKSTTDWSSLGQLQGAVDSSNTALLEIGSVGQRIVARINERMLGTVTDPTPAGMATHYYGNLPVRDIEVMNLDGLPEAEALKILGVDQQGHDTRKPAAVASSSPSTPVSKSSDKFPPGQWVKVFTKTADLPEEVRKNGVKLEDGWLRLGQKKNWITLARNQDGTYLEGNYGIRLRFLRIANSAEHVNILTHVQTQSSKRFYGLKLGTTALFCTRNTETTAANTTLFETPYPEMPKAGEEDTLEFYVVGPRLFGRTGATLVSSAMDDRYKQGPPQISGSEDIRDVEVINLDGLSEAEALKIIGVDEKGHDTRAAALVAEKQAVEQAKVVNAASAIPELKALHEQFQKLSAERVTAPFEADVAKLNTGYLGGIDRKIAEEKAAGQLDGVIALQAEKKLVQGGGVANSQSSNQDLASPAPCPIPAEDAADTPPNLKALRTIYRASHAKIAAARVANLKTLTEPLTLRLKQLEADLTRKDRIDDAKKVREYREALAVANPAATATVAAAGGPPGAKAGAEPGAPAKAAAGKINQREVLEWLLSLGAAVTIQEDGAEKKIISGIKIPTGKIVITAIEYITQDQIWDITDEDLGRLKGLPKLRVLRFGRCPKLTAAGLNAMLGSLPALERLNLNFPQADPGQLVKLPDLPLLQILGGLNDFTAAQFESLPPLKSLREFEGGAGTNDGNLVAIAKRSNLTRLYCSNSKITDNGMAVLAGMQNLEVLYITGGSVHSISGSGLVHLAKLPKLTFLSLGSGSFEVKNVPLIQGLKHLRELSVAGDGLKDHTEWVRQLGEFKGGIEKISLRAKSGFTAEHVAALKKALPKVDVVLN